MMMTIMMMTMKMMMMTMIVQFSGSLDPGLVSQQRTQPTACHRSRHDDGDDNDYDDDDGDDDDDNEEADGDDDIDDEVSKPRVCSVEGLDQSGFQILTLSKVLDSRFLSDKNKLASFEGTLVWKYDRPTDQPSH